MEFNEKLQQLRKERNLTQEQLAESLFISRTAVSKWESGKGYPNIDSLKSISKLFSVSIDELLSGDELITLAETENHSNISKIFSLVFGILDLITLSFIFLPLFGRQDNDFITMVNLFGNPDILTGSDSSHIFNIIFFALPLLIALLGIFQLVIQNYDNNKWLRNSKICSIILHALAINFFIATRQPYAASLLFLFFMIKVVLLIKSHQLK